MTKRRMRIQVGLGGIVMATLLLGALFVWIPKKSLNSADNESYSHEFGGDFDFAFRFGAQALAQGRLDAALAAFEEAATLNANVAEVHVNLGFVLLELERPMDAAAAFDKALELKPGQINAYYGLGEALEAQGDVAGALGAMRAFSHLTNEKDPFYRKAASAIWELETRLGMGAAPAGPIVPLKNTVEPLGRYDALLRRNLGRVVVINVWATWCGPCREELPSLQTLAEKLPQNKAVVLGVSVDDTAEFVLEFLNDHGVTYKNYIDEKGVLSRGQFDINSFPQTMMFDRGGHLVDIISGAQDWSADAVLQKIDEIYDASYFDEGDEPQ